MHTTFVQTAAATGRLSSTNPNLQNVPIRTELGRQIRRAFVPGGSGESAGSQVLLVLDYSQIELRILAHLSGDEGLRAAFASGEDIHTATAARVFGLPLDAVDPASRSRAKMVNYGLAYGMNAWGLAQRLDIAPDEAQEIMDAYFGVVPRRSVSTWTDRWVTPPSRASPRRCSAVAATSRSFRPRTRACATWGGVRRSTLRSRAARATSSRSR